MNLLGKAKQPVHSLGPRRPLKDRFARFADWRLSLIHAPEHVHAVSAPARAFVLAAVDRAFVCAEQLQAEKTSPHPDAKYFPIYPGEHYALLAAFCQIFAPKKIVEVGTFTGMSARVFLDFAATDARLDTIDIIDWRKFDSHLTDKDFESGRIVQHLADISDPVEFDKHIGLFTDADLIFIDGPKDGVFEQMVFPKLLAKTFKPGAVALCDDIKLDAMIDVWADIKQPKLDLTGFGHWSGTGFIELV